MRDIVGQLRMHRYRYRDSQCTGRLKVEFSQYLSEAVRNCDELRS
jgi:hypothetical protein